MENIFSDRISDVPKSFIREILKVTVSENVISFAGGLPNRELFPVEEIKDASQKVLSKYGSEVLQYSTSEGYLPLREWISERYENRLGMKVKPENILITSGSQQGLDLIGKVLINEKENIAIEEPGYLGAIQSFSIYCPVFNPIPLNFEGLDNEYLSSVLKEKKVKLLYTAPNFQNPSGISHSDVSRDKTAEIISSYNTIIVEDDPYGELHFTGPLRKSFFSRIPEQTIFLGSFSKIFVPSFRIGWLAAPEQLIEKLLVAKQASDLHTNYFAQRILYQYVLDNSIDSHIEKITERYYSQKKAMIQAIEKHFPSEIKYSNPDGGMFLWAILPKEMSAKKIFKKAIEKDIAFVPGDPFYINRSDVNTMRLNFSCVDEDSITRGIAVLGELLKREMGK